jgi:3-hydroxymyristoyl/3-hydroxydecanoyl-(acyl carrier protein) dehydratase
MPTLECSFALDHPAAAGHFPGNPIIPGAVLLSTTLRAIEASGQLNLVRGRPLAAKFLHPVRPGDSVRIEFSEIAGGTLKFSGAVGLNVVLTGTVGRENAWTPT